MKPVRVEVNDKMQKGYVYFRSKPTRRAFRRGFMPELTPKQMLELRGVRRKIHDGLPERISDELVQAREALTRSSASVTELFWRDCRMANDPAMMPHLQKPAPLLYTNELLDRICSHVRCMVVVVQRRFPS
jgi:hypothetical protein